MDRLSGFCRQLVDERGGDLDNLEPVLYRDAKGQKAQAQPILLAVGILLHKSPLLQGGQDAKHAAFIQAQLAANPADSLDGPVRLQEGLEDQQRMVQGLNGIVTIDVVHSNNSRHSQMPYTLTGSFQRAKKCFGMAASLARFARDVKRTVSSRERG
jgi:hypothetical protein